MEESPVETCAVPGWAAESHRYFAEQRIFVQQFPAYVYPKAPPFRFGPFSVGHDGWHFVYLTNREQYRYTYLFERQPEYIDVIHYPLDVGYTALWVLRKIAFLPGSPTNLLKWNVRKWSQGSSNRYVILQDPLMKWHQAHSDVLFTGTEEECKEMSQSLHATFQCGLLTAELVHNVDWH